MLAFICNRCSSRRWFYLILNTINDCCWMLVPAEDVLDTRFSQIWFITQSETWKPRQSLENLVLQQLSRVASSWVLEILALLLRRRPTAHTGGKGCKGTPCFQSELFRRSCFFRRWDHHPPSLAESPGIMAGARVGATGCLSILPSRFLLGFINPLLPVSD